MKLKKMAIKIFLYNMDEFCSRLWEKLFNNFVFLALTKLNDSKWNQTKLNETERN